MVTRSFPTWAEAFDYALKLNRIGCTKFPFSAYRHDNWRHQVRRRFDGRWLALTPERTS